MRRDERAQRATHGGSLVLREDIEQRVPFETIAAGTAADTKVGDGVVPGENFSLAVYVCRCMGQSVQTPESLGKFGRHVPSCLKSLLTTLS